jgi:hypothetical protein
MAGGVAVAAASGAGALRGAERGTLHMGQREENENFAWH